MILGSLLPRVSQSDSSCQTSPGEWGKFSLIAIRNRHSARLNVSLGLNKDLDCCAQKQRSSLHDYTTSQFQYLPTVLCGGREGEGRRDNFLCVWSKDVFFSSGMEMRKSMVPLCRQNKHFFYASFIVTSCLQWDNSTINQWQCTIVPKPAINNCEQYNCCFGVDMTVCFVLFFSFFFPCLNSTYSIELLSPLQTERRILSSLCFLYRKNPD